MTNLAIATLEALRNQLMVGGKYAIPSVLVKVIDTELYQEIESIKGYDEHFCADIISLLDSKIETQKEIERKAEIDKIISAQRKSVAEMIAEINAINCNI